MESSNQEMELFLPRPGLWPNNFFYKMFLQGVQNGFSKQETELTIQNGIIYPTSGPLIKKLLKQDVSHFYQGVWHCFSKNYFYKKFLISTKEFQIDFQNRKRKNLNKKWNYLSHFRLSDQKLLLQDVSHFSKGVSNWFSNQEMELFLSYLSYLSYHS